MDAGSTREAGTGLADGLHHQRRLGDAQPCAAELLRHRDAEPAGIGYRAMELVGKNAAAIVLKPVGGIEALAQPGYGFANANLLGREGEIHPLSRRAASRRVAPVP